MSEAIDVALWGIGRHARRNLVPAFRQTGRARVRYVYSRDPRARAWAADELGAEPAETPDTILESDVRAVYLAVPPAGHVPIGSEILSAGKHLWCEKPLTLSAEGAAALASQARDAGTGVFETLMYRHHPQFEAVLRLIDAGAIGEPALLTAAFTIPHLDRDDHRYSAEAGGGALADAAVYPVSLARLLFGPDVSVASAALHTDPGFLVDTRGSAALRAGAVDAQVCWGFGLAYTNEATILGSDGRMLVPRPFSKPDTFAEPLVIRRSDGSVEKVAVEAANHFVKMIERFADDITKGEHEPYTRDAVGQARLMASVAAMNVEVDAR